MKTKINKSSEDNFFATLALFTVASKVRATLLVVLGLSTFSMTNAQAQTDEEIVTMLSVIINGHINKVVHPDGVCLYPEADFKGSSRYCFTGSKPTLPAAWNNQVSSISVSSSYRAMIYSDANYVGTSSFLATNAESLGTLDNLVSSINVIIKDNDGDGVIFSADQCPNTPGGEAVSSVGCSLSQLDTDNDGVSDADDHCINTLPGEPVGLSGCALDPDSDGDSLPDSIDDCDDSAAGAPVDAFGCPTTAPSLVNCVSANGSVRTAQSCNANEQTDTDQDGEVDATDQYPLQPATQCPAN